MTGPVLRAIIASDAPGFTGLGIRAAALAGVPVIVKPRAWSLLRRDCGSDKRAMKWLARLAEEAGRPIAVNFELRDGGSQTIFVSPPGWTAERLQGFIGGLHREIEREFGEVSRIYGPPDCCEGGAG
jgi:hypothetical protein